jgi:cytochrome b subunit of formate dehydrogenase
MKIAIAAYLHDHRWLPHQRLIKFPSTLRALHSFTMIEFEMSLLGLVEMVVEKSLILIETVRLATNLRAATTVLCQQQPIQARIEVGTIVTAVVRCPQATVNVAKT